MALSVHPVRLILKPVGQPGKFRTLKNLNSWSLEVFPRSHELWAIESHLYIDNIDEWDHREAFWIVEFLFNNKFISNQEKKISTHLCLKTLCIDYN